MSEDEDDEVLEEIPVLLTHDLEEQLIVYQYPIIPASLDGGIGQVLKSQIKPENQHVRLEIALDTSSINYDKTHGEQIAASLDKDNSEEDKCYSQQVMDKMEFSSSRSLTDKESYCIGLMKNNELHLTPIRGVLSLKPALVHLEPHSNKEEKEELQQVRVQFARAESERVKLLREQSYSTYSKRVSQEKWFMTEYHDVNSSLAQDMRKRLSSTCRNEVSLSKEGYLCSVTPQEQKPISQTPALPDSLLSLNSLRLLDLSDRVKILLKEVNTINQSQLVWACQEEDEKVLQCVQEAAVLVQGNWVLRSDLLFPKDTFSPHNGVPAEAMVRARDYILYHLNNARILERRSLASLVKIPTEELKDIMSRVAVLKQNKVWCFRLPPDEAFLRRYPQIVEREERLWAARYERLKEALSESSELAPPSHASPRKKERRRKDSSLSSGGEEDVSKTPKGRRKKDFSASSGSEEDRPKKVQNRNKKKASAAPVQLHQEVTKVNGVCASVKMEPLDPTPQIVNLKREIIEEHTADCS